MSSNDSYMWSTVCLLDLKVWGVYVPSVCISIALSDDIPCPAWQHTTAFNIVYDVEAEMFVFISNPYKLFL